MSIAPVSVAPVLTQAATDDSIKEKVLEIVAEKTGYPKDMLDLDLDLEADLGVDTVKQAEMFAAVRAAYNIPRDENLKLRDFPNPGPRDSVRTRPAAGRKNPTCSSGTDLSSERLTDARCAPGVFNLGTCAVAAKRPTLASFDAANRIPRRVPVPTLRPPLAICKPTGVTLGSGRRVVIMPDKRWRRRRTDSRLQSDGSGSAPNRGDSRCRGVVESRQRVAGCRSDPRRLLAARARQRRRPEQNGLRPHGMRPCECASNRCTPPCAFCTSRLRNPARSWCRRRALGGQHGYDDAGAVAHWAARSRASPKPTSASGRTPSSKQSISKPTARSAKVAEILVEETLRDPGAVEIGYKGGLRWTVGLQEQPAADGQPGLTLDSRHRLSDHRGCGKHRSAITADLAAASGGTFYLLDLVPEPDPNNPDLKRFISDKEGLKRDLFARIQARGERATPALVEKELAALERAQAAL